MRAITVIEVSGLTKYSVWQIKAFGLNRLDISQREGKYPAPPGASSILGVEFAGVVTELGPGVTEWSVGDEVLGLTKGVSIEVSTGAMYMA